MAISDHDRVGAGATAAARVPVTTLLMVVLLGRCWLIRTAAMRTGAMRMDTAATCYMDMAATLMTIIMLMMSIHMSPRRIIMFMMSIHMRPRRRTRRARQRKGGHAHHPAHPRYQRHLP